ncbi:MAG TPA: LamG-like jellyroll fold domain-containing protein [Armatimonadota bacterium]|jgi:hypothetical protein
MGNFTGWQQRLPAYSAKPLARACLLLFALLGATLIGRSAILTRMATDYAAHQVANVANLSLIGTTGNLAGITGTQQWNGVMGWFDYSITVDTAGWYELLTNYNVYPYSWTGPTDYFIDSNRYLNLYPITLSSGQEKIGNVWLATGNHTLRISHWNWIGFPPVASFEFRKVVDNDITKDLRIGLDATTNADGSHGHYAKLGSAFNVYLYTGGTATGTFTAEVVNADTSVVLRTYTVNISASPTAEASNTINVACDTLGRYYLRYKVNGNLVPTNTNLSPVTFRVLDNAAITTTPSNSDMTKTLITTINCATTAPNYVGGSNDPVFGAQTRVVTTAIGSYREGGSYGYRQYHDLQGAIQPNWFAYTLPNLTHGTQYLVEVDYPDDQARSFVVEMRQRDPTQYRQGPGIDSGREHPLSNTMLTARYFLNPQWTGEAPRIVIMNSQTGYRAAAAAIRVYSITAPLPVLPAASANARSFGFWFEEEQSYVGPWGVQNTSAAEVLPAMERWAGTTKYLGGDTLVVTAHAYGSIIPRRGYDGMFTYSVTGDDQFRGILTTAERYGLKVIADYQPQRTELLFKYNEAATDPYRQFAMNRYGQTTIDLAGGASANYPVYNPLYPDCQDWLQAMLEEFVNMYKDSPALAGISLRAMFNWNNPGFNNFQSLDWGYDTYTAQQFCAAIGITDPGTPQTRYATFTNATYLQKWLNWRAQQINNINQRMANAVRALRSDLTIYALTLGPDYFSASDAKKAGMTDVGVTGYRPINGSYRYGRSSFATTPDSAAYDWDKARMSLMHSPSLGVFASSRAFLNAANYIEDGGGTVPSSAVGLAGASSAWLSGHIFGAGRNQLEKYAIPLAEYDCSLFLNGANDYFIDDPVYIREFMKEYRLLTTDYYKAVNSVRDPVVARDFTGSDYRFYLINRTGQTQTVALDFAQTATITRLYNNATTSTTNNVITLTLQPFELQVYKSNGSHLRGVQTVNANAPTGDLILNYHFDEASGAVAKDSSGNGNDGLLGNETAWSPTSGKLHGAYTFNGTSSLNGGFLPQLGSDLTVAFWMKANAMAVAEPVNKITDDGLGAGWGISLRDNGQIWFRVGDLSNETVLQSGNGAYATGTWVHVAATFSNGTAKLYINGGTPLTQTGISQTVLNANAMCYLGKFQPWNGGYPYNGSIDEFRIYRRALNDTEITNLVNGGAENGLVGRWALDESAGSLASDSSGNGNNGVLTGDALPTWAPAGGKILGGLNFDGGYRTNDQAVNCGTSVGNSPAMTVAFWMKANALSYYEPIDKIPNDTSDAGWTVSLREDGNIWFRVGTMQAASIVSTTAPAYAVNQWVHVAASFANGSAKLYINGGTPVVLNGITRTTMNPNATLVIGYLYVWNAYQFNGTIDDVRLYDRALSDSEVTALAGSNNEDGATACWKLDDVSGNAVDSTGNGHVGTLAGATLPVWAPGSGRNAGALSFTGTNGTNSVVNCGATVGNTPSMTAAFWMKASKLDYMEPLFKSATDASGAGWAVKLRLNGDLWFRVGSETNCTDVMSTGVYAVDRWVHVAVTFTGGTAKIYANGALLSTRTGITQTVVNANAPLYLGLYYPWSAYLYGGLLDDVRIYNRALSDTEIAALARDSSLAANWKLDESTGNAQDSTGNGNTGVVANTTWSPSGGHTAGALVFNGSTSAVTCPSTAGAKDAMTVGFWMRPDGLANQAPLDKTAAGTGGFGWSVRLTAAGRVTFQVGSESSNTVIQDANATYAAAAWTHVAVTFVGGSAKLYTGGVLRATINNVPQAVRNVNSPLTMGQSPVAGQSFSGRLDDVRIYDRALSDNEVAAIAR